MNVPISSVQFDPSVHGLGEHSLILIRQSGPSKPSAHLQRNHSLFDSHVPPLWHGLEAQKSTGDTSIIVSHNVPLYSLGQIQ